MSSQLLQDAATPTASATAVPGRPYRQPRNAWAIVARREITAKLTDKAFLTGTLVTLLLIVGLTGVSIFMGSRGTRVTIAVTGDQAAAVVAAADLAARQANDDSAFTALRVADDDEARQQVLDGQADAMLVRGAAGFTLWFEREPDPVVQSMIASAVDAQVLQLLAGRAGMTPAELAEATTVEVALLDGDSDRAMLAKYAGFIFAALFFMSALTFGMQIASSVVEEKASRIVEIISAVIPIRQLLAGKILGNTVLGFGQMALFAIVGLVGISFTSYKALLPALTSAVVWYLAYFVAGFLALACIWAVAGSLASRMEDLSATTTPLTLGLTLVYMAGLFSSGTLQAALSYLPVLSSVLMPQRLVAGTAQWYDLVLGLLLNLAFACVTVMAGERIYRRALLQTSGAISYRDALKLTD